MARRPRSEIRFITLITARKRNHGRNHRTADLSFDDLFHQNLSVSVDESYRSTRGRRRIHCDVSVRRTDEYPLVFHLVDPFIGEPKIVSKNSAIMLAQKGCVELKRIGKGGKP